MKNTVIVIVGPTASGKTALSVEIAKKINGEIISADSMQIYKRMDIATAKPTKEEMKSVPHHLIDFVSPDENFSVAKYKDLAYEKIADIVSRDKTPVIVGGTGLYVDAVVNNTVFLDYEKSDIRKTLEEEAEKGGIEALYQRLLQIDPQTAQRLHLNDSKRIIRALEIYYDTGKTITEQNACSHSEKPKYDFILIGLNASDRQFLYNRIDKRVDSMLSQGLLEEAKAFYSMPYSQTAKQAIGYKELKPYLDGELSLDECVENLKRETRRYAKRQLTWFRKYEKINWLYIDSSDDLTQKALEILSRAEVLTNEKNN